MARSKYIPDRGDIVWLDFDPQVGHEQQGIRPALVMSIKDYNNGGLMMVCPITSKLKSYPYEVKIQQGKIKGAILADQAKSQDWRQRKVKFICKANKDILRQVQKHLFSILLN